MSVERPDLVEVAEAYVEQDFQEKNKRDIFHAEKIANGAGCQCPNCVRAARDPANFAIEDIDPTAPYSYKTELSTQGKLKLVRSVDITVK